MKKLKSNLFPRERKLLKKINESGRIASDLNKEELETLNGLKYVRSTSAPFVKEFITQIECVIYALGDIKDLTNLKYALENPARPLYIGASDDFVIIDNIEIVDAIEDKSNSIDSIMRINDNIQPIDKKRIVGRFHINLRLSILRKKNTQEKMQSSLLPLQRTKLLLNGSIECYIVEGDHIAF
jgi:hypothetical protein